MKFAKLHVIETRNFGDLIYTRWEFESPALGMMCRYGTLVSEKLSKSPDKIGGTIYYLHGGNGDDRQPIEAELYKALSSDIQNLLLDKGYQIVFPWVGVSFLSDERLVSGKSYSSYFTDEVIPAAEAGTATAESTRFIAGYSMGGQAALNYFLRHLDKFAGVGASFPTLITFNPFDNAEVASFSKRNSVVPPWLDILHGEFKREFKTIVNFSRHDPIKILNAVDIAKLKTKKIHIDVGSNDEFGLYEGVRVFHELLNKTEVAHSFTELPGGKHDAALLHVQFPKFIKVMLG